MMTPEDEVQAPAPSKFHDPITERIERRHLVDQLATVMAEDGFEASKTTEGVTMLRARTEVGDTWADLSETAKAWAVGTARPFAESAVDAGWRPTNLDERIKHDEIVRTDAVRKVARLLRGLAKQAKGQQLGVLLTKVATKIEEELKTP